ncbi:cystathionine gamma-synthase [Candidatus Marsarchaeota G2 archaeon BE_D]|jgi:Cystathionine beta-lyases/cystathionine gamma-synthases|uniref:Cystathionine gamma-synthase n=1 Tax=Candidatus Marsarchaeota G2 archaeon BE_D TaxID=1978158 RepID=A0A2R6CBY4_9ARCH|nr:MAG: cystathionine gamma-synthase [Candidatus Marsarchaeota G2 archaeon BE_D]
MRFSTRAIHVGEEPDLEGGGNGDVVAPIHPSTTFARKVREVDKPSSGYEYSRTGNPTRDALEKKLAALEDAKYALAFSSGLAAEATVTLSLLRAGDHVVASEDLYGGTRRLFSRSLAPFGVSVSYVDLSDPDDLKSNIREKTRMIWLESPTNPLLRVYDIKAISEFAHTRGILCVVDNTFASPYFQRPLGMGCDIVVHSTTKYLGGHSDVVGGAVMTSNEEVYSKLRFNQNAIGAVPSPFDCFLTMRGIKTLAIRMEKHAANAQRVAEYLESSRQVNRVFYPGLPSNPHHELARRQMSGFGGMVSADLKGGVKGVNAFLSALKIFTLAESLGGVESLVDHPATMTHAGMSGEERLAVGITDTLLRFSVGIEDVEDLIEDLERGLKNLEHHAATMPMN